MGDHSTRAGGTSEGLIENPSLALRAGVGAGLEVRNFIGD
jgi:hypothetical protein